MSIKQALISVSDKTGITELAKELQKLNIEILSTGGTAKTLKDAGIKVIDVSDYTGFPEMMNGRVKTLHPKIHGGLLALRNNKEHQKQAKEHGITMIDLVIVNLYPFEQTIAKEGVAEEEAIEQIDIGGPSMLRSAAKNFQSVTVVTDINDYEKLLTQIKESGDTNLEFRRELALKVFEKTYRYDLAISNYLRGETSENERLDLGHYEKIMTLRYGENPHQKAAFFRNPKNEEKCNVTNAKVLHGKQLSFNNIIDADSALELVKEFEKPAAVFVKHNNPCGVAQSDDLQKAFEYAHQVDPMSAFGCIIAINRPFTLEMANYMNKEKMFAELIICPAFEKSALEKLKTRENIRLLETGPLSIDFKRRDLKKVAGGILVQNANTYQLKKEELKTVTNAKANETQIEEMMFAFKVCKHTKSNAIIFAKKLENGVIVTTGIGAGQMSRVDSTMIAKHKGGKNVPGSVMASDAFFPFPDSIEVANEAGIKAIIEPGGSIRDDLVIAKANEYGIAMVFSGIRCFKH
ncbi:bifunctional phosphoribosylaminoimidazolecarboxamide formyltransferase/IMP cyclohydrolase [Candidatus Peregrinibacteria bacterium RIFOXYB2_FULL_32_7]|nr:MAG: bifunctional phosphoribosylaminoimidazolecarboxamide formyltransferase/IMP cyclohydrolase [Candidatus Peregrinibacteria bacterium RIFOXYB2_FULL_32_7]